MNRQATVYVMKCRKCSWYNKVSAESCFYCGTYRNMSTAIIPLRSVENQYQWNMMNTWTLEQEEIEEVMSRWKVEFQMEFLL